MREYIKEGKERMKDQEKLISFRKIAERVWPTPSAADSIRFTYQELGEADSIAMKLGHRDKEYLRNSPLKVGEIAARADLTRELGQAYMMMMTYADQMGVDMSFALVMALIHQANKLVDTGDLSDKEYEELREIAFS